MSPSYGFLLITVKAVDCYNLSYHKRGGYTREAVGFFQCFSTVYIDNRSFSGYNLKKKYIRNKVLMNFN